MILGSILFQSGLSSLNLRYWSELDTDQLEQYTGIKSSSHLTTLLSTEQSKLISIVQTSSLLEYDKVEYFMTFRMKYKHCIIMRIE